jgi:hypothetical protein
MRTEILFQTQEEIKKGCPNCKLKTKLRGIAWGMDSDKIICDNCGREKIVVMSLKNHKNLKF